jgi:hypothetical protein
MDIVASRAQLRAFLRHRRGTLARLRRVMEALSRWGAIHAAAGMYEAFRAGLHELGYLEDQNVVLEPRFAEGSDELLPLSATELSACPSTFSSCRVADPPPRRWASPSPTSSCSRSPRCSSSAPCHRNVGSLSETGGVQRRMALGSTAYLSAKARGDNRMPLKRGTSEDA